MDTPNGLIHNRTLLPAPAASEYLHNSRDGADDDAMDDGSGPSANRVKRKQVSVACEQCRRRKAKCDGLRPVCRPCMRRGCECHYMADPDVTRMATLKRRFDTLSNRHNHLEDLLYVLRESSDEDSHAALAALRGGSDASEVLHLARHRHLVVSAADVRDLAILTDDSIVKTFPYSYYPLHTQPAATFVRARMDIKALLIEPSQSASPEIVTASRLNACPASPSSTSRRNRRSQDRLWFNYMTEGLVGVDLRRWTKVTQDAELLSHLVSMYIAWESPTCFWSGQPEFLDDLVHGRQDFCSSLLVNTMAALGSRITPRFSKRSNTRDADNLGSMFLKEATEQLNAEDKPVDLCTVQATLTLAMIYNMDGLISTAAGLLARVMSMADQLKLFTPQSPEGSSQTSFWMRSARLTAWAVSNYQTCEHFAARTRSPYNVLPFQVPSLILARQGAAALPVQILLGFPLPTQAAMDTHHESVFLAYSNIQVLQAELTQVKYDDSGEYTVAAASRICVEIIRVLETIPKALQPPACITPHTLFLHMVCHAMILDVLYPLRDADQMIAIDMSSAEGRKAVRVGDLTRLSRRQITFAIDLQRAQWGFERGPLIIFQVFSIVVLELRRDLATDTAARDLFCSVIRAMRELAESWYHERQRLWSIRSLLMHERHLLPDDVWECLNVGADPTGEGITDGDASGSMSCPGDARSADESPTMSRLSGSNMDRGSVPGLSRRMTGLDGGEDEIARSWE